jgi:DNA-binding NarL/FixJ family response regulator
MTIGVIIADDQALVRAGFRVLVESAPDMTVLGEAGDGAEAVRLSARHHPDVILMDIRMPILDGIEATRHITGGDMSARTRVLILTTFDLDEYVYAALQSGASGFLLKDAVPDNLLDAIRVVAGGESLLAPSVTRRLIQEFAARSSVVRTDDSALKALTIREREVLAEIARGLSNAEIADRLHMSVATAKTHVNRLLNKLRARDRAQLVVLAYETGVVSPG